MSFWRPSEIAKRGLEQLVAGDDNQDEEAKAAVAVSRKRKLAAGVVIVSVLGLLALSGALTAIVQWLLGALFLTGLIGGVWYLVRKKWFAFRAARAEKQEVKREETSQRDKQRALEDQLAQLKKKREAEKQ